MPRYSTIRISNKNAEIPYDSSIYSKCRLRGFYGGPWDNFSLSDHTMDTVVFRIVTLEI